VLAYYFLIWGLFEKVLALSALPQTLNNEISKNETHGKINIFYEITLMS
jgi:hypothetical protein